MKNKYIRLPRKEKKRRNKSFSHIGISEWDAFLVMRYFAKRGADPVPCEPILQKGRYFMGVDPAETKEHKIIMQGMGIRLHDGNTQFIVTGHQI